MRHDPVRLAPMANAVRALAMDAVEAANSGHPGMPMGMADAATVLWTEYLRFDPAAPDWPDRDRFVLSAGHGSMLLYALLHLVGFERPTMDDIRGFRQVGSLCAGHPENFLLDAVEATTGPLGQGLAMAVGMAIAERHLNAVHGDDLVDHRTWAIAGDGCLMEGINHEAIGLAGHLKLGRLNVLWDDNRITIDGSTDLSTSEDVRARYRACRWHVVDCNGHDADDVRRALDEALADERPSLIACKTIIGKGAPNKAGTSKVHGAALGADEVAAARATLGWTAPAFEVPDDILSDWRKAGIRGQQAHAEWRERLQASGQAEAFTARMSNKLPEPAQWPDWADYKAQVAEAKPNMASRKASEAALGVLTQGLSALVGGSADLTGSNNTKTPSTTPLTAEDYAGRYVYYGIREFGMSAAMNGMALHGGVIPFGGTFLVFADYMRPAIRLSALQQVRVVYVLTHDSIGLGEDGPTHQPVEHLASLRAIPDLLVMRPADTLETAECWELALQQADRPSVLALTRQNLPALRFDASENLSARGAYRLRAAGAERRVILIATGSEVALACDVAEVLEGQGIGADVVSMPCAELFDEQPAEYREELLPNVLPEEILRVSIEAGSTFGWERYTMLNGLRIGLDRFGSSGKGEDLFEKFGFTVEAIVPQITARLNK